MPQMSIAARTTHFHATHPMSVVFELAHRRGIGRLIEAGPAAAAVVLGLRPEKFLAASLAQVHARCLGLVVLAGKRRLGAALAQDAVLVRRQLRPTLGITL